jgi:hypothetical protein
MNKQPRRTWFMVLFGFLMLVGLFSVSCTSNQRAKKFGGSMSIELSCQQKLVNVTWKDDELWYLTRPMRADETAEISTFQEDSSFGLMEGKVTITECDEHHVP